MCDNQIAYLTIGLVKLLSDLVVYERVGKIF